MNISYVVLLRAHIIFFWLVAIFLFLFFPSLSRLWQPQRAINIMTWADLLDPFLIEQFEKETGTKVYLSYFESNEELYARFRATGGKGHDLILPSDFMVQTLIQDGLLKPLDISKLSLWSRLDTRLLHLYYDPANNYSIPYYWAVYGIGYNKKAFENVFPESWKIIFDECSKEKPLVMPETVREVISIAAFHLFGTIDNLDEKKLERVKKLLLEQKKCVGAYSETRADYLLIVQEFSLAVVPSAILWQTLKRYSYLEFIVPREGTFVMIDNFAIPKQSTKEDLVYQFLNFLYRPENIRYTFEQHRFFPATVDLIPLLQEYDAAPSIIKTHSADPSSWQFFKNVIPRDMMEEIWVAVKGK